jgi:hypothetical protein
MDTQTSRRQLLGGAGLAFAAASAMAPRETAAAPNMSGGRAPPDVGRKFFADGRVRRFAGNTIICHAPQQDGPFQVSGFETFDALLGIYRDLPGHGFSRKLAVLPPSSYHMTIFGGADDQERKPGLWPADVPLDAPMAVCDAALAERLVGFELDCALPIRMRINDAEPPVHPAPILIDLIPLDDAEALKLRRLRDRLSNVLKIRQPDHDHYAYHISIAYQIDWFTAEEQADYVAARRRWREQLKRQIPVLNFGPPEYCTLNDMFAFRRRLTLG